jgi:hypothetical protein
MLLLLHGVLLSSEVSERDIRMYRVSHFKEKFMKSFSFFLKGVIAQLTSATVVFAQALRLSSRRKRGGFPSPGTTRVPAYRDT